MRDELLTEAVCEDTRDLSRRSTREIVAAIHAADASVAAAVERVLPEIVRAVDLLVLVLQGGGRWFNVGAGTSGRLGTIDAAELLPTFGFPPERVEGIMAGGVAALVRAAEGAEDDAQAARDALRARELMPGDAVLAISASGRTPFALAALEEARGAGARRIALTCDPASPIARAAEVSIAPVVGPEVVAGSTRMKGGLAQKMVLHTLSTAVMVRLGRVEGNEMTSLVPSSRKLERRALRIVCERTGAPEACARAALAAAHGSVSGALALLRRGASAGEPTR
jgi:N-acetylmuramic acid 6-phosphate etherase